MACTFSHNPAHRSCHFRLLMLGRNMSSQSYSMPFTLVTSLLLVRANLKLASGGVKTRLGRNTDVRRPILVLCAVSLTSAHRPETDGASPICHNPMSHSSLSPSHLQRAQLWKDNPHPVCTEPIQPTSTQEKRNKEEAFEVGCQTTANHLSQGALRQGR